MFANLLGIRTPPAVTRMESAGQWHWPRQLEWRGTPIYKGRTAGASSTLQSAVTKVKSPRLQLVGMFSAIQHRCQICLNFDFSVRGNIGGIESGLLLKLQTIVTTVQRIANYLGQGKLTGLHCVWLISMS